MIDLSMFDEMIVFVFEFVEDFVWFFDYNMFFFCDIVVFDILNSEIKYIV